MIHGSRRKYDKWPAKFSTYMKNVHRSVWALALCGVTLWASGCGKQEAGAPPNATDTSKTTAPGAPAPPIAAETHKGADADKAAAELAKAAEAQKAVDAAKAADELKQKAAAAQAEAERAAADKAAAEKLAAANAANQVQAQGLIDSATKLVGENKYTDALKVLADLSKLKLTDAQQKLVDTLKDQVNKAMLSKGASEAQKAVGGLLPK
jgi:hypothetical protein